MHRFMWLLSVWGCIMLAGCSLHASPKTDEPEPVTLTFWFDNAGTERAATWATLIDEFEQTYPHITIESEAIVKDYAKSKFDAAIASGNAPDVASIYTSWLPEYMERGALQPLDAYALQSESFAHIPEKMIRFQRQIVADARLYSIPYTQNIDVLWVRTDWLAQQQRSVPTTWDAFFDTVDALTNTEQQRYGYSIRGGAGSSFQLQRMMYAYSGITSYIENGESTIDDPLHVAFAKRYFSLYATKTPMTDITSDYASMLVRFGSGEVGMIQHNLGSYAEHMKTLQTDQFTAVPLPPSIEGHHVVENGNTIGLSMFTQSEHPQEAWAFIEFMTAKEAQLYWNTAANQMPTNAEATAELHDEQHLPHIQMALDVYAHPDTLFYDPPFYLSDYTRIRTTIVEPGIQEVLSGNKTVEVMLTEWADAIEEAAAHYTEQQQFQ